MKNLCEIINGLTGIKPSAGTVSNMLHSAANMAKPIVDSFPQKLLQKPVVHCDEIGLSVNGEQTGIFENHPQQKWALDVYYELLSMCHAADFYNQNPEINSRKFYMDCLKQNYDAILEEAIR